MIEFVNNMYNIAQVIYLSSQDSLFWAYVSFMFWYSRDLKIGQCYKITWIRLD